VAEPVRVAVSGDDVAAKRSFPRIHLHYNNAAENSQVLESDFVLGEPKPANLPSTIEIKRARGVYRASARVKRLIVY